MNTCPSSVTVIGWLFIVTGVVGLAYHAAEFKPSNPFQYDLVWVGFVRLLAIVGGVLLLRGSTGARWLVVGWLGYHVVLSAFHSLSELVTHLLLLAVVSWFLFRPAASAYFAVRR